MITDTFKSSYLSILEGEEHSFKNKVKSMMKDILLEESGLSEVSEPTKNYLKELEQYVEKEFGFEQDISNMFAREPGMNFGPINKAIGEAEKTYSDTGNSEYSFYEFLFQESGEVVDKFLSDQPEILVNFMERLYNKIKQTR